MRFLLVKNCVLLILWLDCFILCNSFLWLWLDVEFDFYACLELVCVWNFTACGLKAGIISLFNGVLACF